MITDSKEATIEFPFRISKTGTIATVTDQKTIWSNKVTAVLGTFVTERVMRSDFGSRINEAFWNTETFSLNNIEPFIQEAFAKWLPTIELMSVSISNINTQGYLYVTVVYALPNNETATTTVGAVAVSGNQLPSQELL